MATRKSVPEIHDYWKNPSEENNPIHYLDKLTSPYLLSVVNRVANSNFSILEIGCNSGRNLQRLWIAGYSQLSGVEINPGAVSLMQERFPEMSKIAQIHVGAIEDESKNLGQHDIVFSVAVLCHIHSDSEWVLEEIAKCSRRYVLTIEDEKTNKNRHFARNYKDVFENFGMKEIYFGENIPNMHKVYKARLFEKQQGE